MAWRPCPHYHPEWWRARVLKTVVTEDNPDEFSIHGNSSSNPQPPKDKGLPCEAASSRPQFWYRTVQRYSQFYQGLCPVVINDSDRKSTTARGAVASGTHMQIAMSPCTGVSVCQSLLPRTRWKLWDHYPVRQAFRGRVWCWLQSSLVNEEEILINWGLSSILLLWDMPYSNLLVL